jgi:hypothetical protein
MAGEADLGGKGFVASVDPSEKILLRVLCCVANIGS